MSTVIRFHETGAPQVLRVEGETVGLPGAGQVRLRHEAIGVNYVDTMFRSGAFGASLPFVTGVEGAGIVEAVGPGVDNIKPGDRVGYFFAPGAYAAVRLIAADVLIPLPDDIPGEEAAAFLTKGLTAWMGLRDLYPVKAGDTVLVQGATGGVGAILARWATDLGATVMGTGSAGKLDRLAGGVAHALDAADPRLEAAIRRVAPDGVHVVYELIGRATFGASAAVVRDGGTIVNIGAASGAPNADPAVLSALAARGVRGVGGSTGQSVRGRIKVAAGEVFDAYRRGVFGALEIQRYPLAEAARAHVDIADRSLRGSAVLIP